MNIHRVKLLLPAFTLLLFSCARTAAPLPATVPPSSPTQISSPTTMHSTEIPAEVPSNNDPSLFGAIPQTEIQAYSLEPVASAIFNKVMDGFITNGNILEYQVTRVTIFPSGDGSLYAEITYDVRTADTSWLADGGTQTEDNWIQNKCNRFDFITTETEFQLKNRRTCN